MFWLGVWGAGWYNCYDFVKYILAFPAALSRYLFVVTSSVKGEIYVNTIETCTISCSQIESWFLFLFAAYLSFIAHAGRYRPVSLSSTTPEDRRPRLRADGKDHHYSQTTPLVPSENGWWCRIQTKSTFPEAKTNKGANQPRQSNSSGSSHSRWADHHLQRADPCLQIWPNHQSSTEDELVENNHTDQQTYALYIRLPKMPKTLFNQASIACVLTFSTNLYMI